MLEGNLLEEIQSLLTNAPEIADARAEAHRIVDASRSEGVLNRERALDLAKRRATGTPLALLLGYTEFMGIELIAEEGVLAAREETQTLGWTAVKLLRDIIASRPNEELRIIDMGCGAGNLTCGIATAVPTVKIFASDVTQECVGLSRKNIEKHAFGNRVTLTCGDLFEPLTSYALDGTIDMIVSNPPYIATGTLSGDRAILLEHEPREAFDGGPYGLTIHQRIIKEAPKLLKPGGWLLFEFGLGQDRQLKILLERSRAFQSVEFVSNELGQLRVVKAKLK